MTILLKTTAALAMVAGLATPAFSQTAQGTGNAAIVAPLTITAADTLEFGSVARPVSGSALVTIDPTTGNRTLGTGIVGVSGGTTPQRGTFTLAGEGERTFTANVPAVLTLTGPGTDITVNLTSVVPTKLTGGAATIGVGGSFSLGSGQASGAYTGTYDVTVAYN